VQWQTKTTTAATLTTDVGILKFQYFSCYQNRSNFVYAADLSIALVYSVASPTTSSSYIIKFFGNPDNYASKLSDLSTTPLPIHIDQGHSSSSSDVIRSIAVNYRTQWLYFGNNYQGILQKSLLIYKNDSLIYFFSAIPTTYNVSLYATHTHTHESNLA
jgi:hypothetical protein